MTSFSEAMGYGSREANKQIDADMKAYRAGGSHRLRERLADSPVDPEVYIRAVARLENQQVLARAAWDAFERAEASDEEQQLRRNR